MPSQHATSQRTLLDIHTEIIDYLESFLVFARRYEENPYVPDIDHANGVFGEFTEKLLDLDHTLNYPGSNNKILDDWITHQGDFLDAIQGDLGHAREDFSKRIAMLVRDTAVALMREHQHGVHEDADGSSEIKARLADIAYKARSLLESCEK